LIVYPKSTKQASDIIVFCNENNVRWQVIGNGSNLLVDDNGVRGVLICISSDMSQMQVLENNITCGAGASLTLLCKTALSNSLSGLEFAWGIPGNVGGAVYMNAGAYGGEMKDVVFEVEYLDENGEIHNINCEKLDFSYRHSFFTNKNCIITSVVFNLVKGDKTLIKEKMDDLISRRRDKQPLEFPSAGSTFKRPEGNFAGALIEQCNLKGYTVGGAQVSEKHAGFVINRKNATCDDVEKLVEHIKKTVLNETGYNLECEIKKMK
jgi:UDP-N-acetylmuramate dehydrogenase